MHPQRLPRNRHHHLCPVQRIRQGSGIVMLPQTLYLCLHSIPLSRQRIQLLLYFRLLLLAGCQLGFLFPKVLGSRTAGSFHRIFAEGFQVLLGFIQLNQCRQTLRFQVIQPMLQGLLQGGFPLGGGYRGHNPCTHARQRKNKIHQLLLCFRHLPRLLKLSTGTLHRIVHSPHGNAVGQGGRRRIIPGSPHLIGHNFLHVVLGARHRGSHPGTAHQGGTGQLLHRHHFMMNLLPLMEQVRPVAHRLIQPCQCFRKALVLIQNGQGFADGQWRFRSRCRLCLDDFRLGFLLLGIHGFLTAKDHPLLAIRAGKLVHHGFHFRGMVGGCRVLPLHRSIQHIPLLHHKQGR